MKLVSPFLTDVKQINAWLKSMGINDWSINDGLVDVQGDVALVGKLGLLTKLPVRFGKVSGDFYCGQNQLVCLDGVPKYVGGDFSCSKNQLVSLEGAPNVGGQFSCYSSRLVSLVGAPDKVVGNFLCYDNQLVSLVGAPKVVGGDFNCRQNQLVNLEGAPKEVGRHFECQHNQLVSLEGAPIKVGAHLWCDHNLLADFKGLESTSIRGSLLVTDQGLEHHKAGQDNVIKSLNGLPKDLYSKVVGLDVQAVVELAKKRAASLLGAEVEELSSEVELG